MAKAKKKVKITTVTFQLPATLKAQLLIKAARKGMFIGAYINDIIKKAK